MPVAFVKGAFERKAERDGSDPLALMEASYSRYALGHLGDSNDAAGAASFLATDAAK